MLSRQPKLHPQKYVVKIRKGKKGLVLGSEDQEGLELLAQKHMGTTLATCRLFAELNQQQKELPLLREKEIVLNLCLQEFILLRKKYSW